MGVNALEVRRRVMLAQPHEAVASGAVASFRTDVVSALPIEFDLVPIQTGEGDPSPENVRPITGHDGFTRTGTGKNLLDIDALISAPSGEIATYDFKHVYVIHLEPNTNYTLSTSYSGTRNVLYFNSANAVDVVRSGSPVTKVSSATGELIIGLFDRTGIGQFENKTVTVQLEKGDSATAYQPFGHSYETEFPTPPGTVYGGHVRDNGDGTGTLVVEQACVTISSLSVYSAFAIGTYSCIKRFRLPSNAVACAYNQKHGAIASFGVESNAYYGSDRKNDAGSANVDFAIGTDGVAIAVYDTDLTLTDTSFMDKYGSGQVCYPLATPVSYTLSLTAIQSLIGQNHVWVDNADSVTVEYWGH